MARVSGIEPDPRGWTSLNMAPKAIVLPLHYTRILLKKAAIYFGIIAAFFRRAKDRNRTGAYVLEVRRPSFEGLCATITLLSLLIITDSKIVLGKLLEIIFYTKPPNSYTKPSIAKVVTQI